MDLVGMASTLYVLPLDSFTDARNAAAKEAAGNGDKALAAALRKLPKPSSAAWLVNVLVDRRRGEVEQVLELGASLKEAQASLDRAQLHALGQQRQRLLAAVARQSLEVAAEVGRDVGPAALPGVEQTLRAALADPAAAAAVLTRRLVRTLEATGWEPVDLEGAVAGPFTPPSSEPDTADAAESTGEERGDGASNDVGSTGTATRTTTKAERDERARSRKAAEARLAAANDDRSATKETAAALERKAQRLGVRRDGITASIDDLEERLDALRRELADLDDEAAGVRREQEGAARAVEEATDAVAAARADLGP